MDINVQIVAEHIRYTIDYLISSQPADYMLQSTVDISETPYTKNVYKC